jgi:hypothetical protein
MGNAAVWKMMDAYENSQRERNRNEEMFMTGEVANPSNVRVEAGNWYRQAYPDGPFLKMLRFGQVLTVSGFLVTFALLAI